MKRERKAVPLTRAKARKVEVACTVFKATCVRQSLGASVTPAWKAAINADIERIGAIVWLGSRAFHHFLTTRVATGKATLPNDDNALARLIKACFTVHCTGASNTAARRAPDFVEWRTEWEADVASHLPGACAVSVGGLGNALQFECAEYLTAFKKHLRYGLVDLYTRTLRAVDRLSKRDAEAATARRLCGSPYFKGVFPKHTEADPDATLIETHQQAFEVLCDCLRAIERTKSGKNFHLAPLVGPSRRFLFLDARQLLLMYQHYPTLRSADGPPSRLGDVFSLGVPRKGFTLGASVRTDGVQVVARWEKPFEKRLTMSATKHDEWVVRQKAKAALTEQYEDQQRRLAAGEKLAEGEALIDGKRVRTKRKYDGDAPVFLTTGLPTAERGLFKESAIPTKGGVLPTVVAIDPGHCNVWAASRSAEGGAWEALTPISSGRYRHESGLRPFQQWSKRSLRRPALRDASVALTEASLKTPDPVAFTAALLRQAGAWDVLRTFYGSKTFAKRRFLRARRKQRFEETAVNRLIAESERGRDAPAVFAYGDGQFASSMRGCHGGTPHARLRRLLALKRRVVMVDEYLTTKRCPTCRCETHLTKEERKTSFRTAYTVQPKGKAKYTRKDGVEVLKQVHGLSHCHVCATLWGRDHAATLNIGRVFVAKWQTGTRPAYLCRPITTKCVAASKGRLSTGLLVCPDAV